MTKCEELYKYYMSAPKAGYAEVAGALGRDSMLVREYKHRLKIRGPIRITDAGVETEQPFGDIDPVIRSNKQEAYRHLYEVCMDRLETKDLTDSQFATLVQEIRMIIEKM